MRFIIFTIFLFALLSNQSLSQDTKRANNAVSITHQSNETSQTQGSEGKGIVENNLGSEQEKLDMIVRAFQRLPTEELERLGLSLTLFMSLLISTRTLYAA
jgi:hypothetical protein